MTAILRTISDCAYGIAGVLFVLSAYIAAARLDMPNETDALALTAEVSNDRAAEFAAFNNQEAAAVASKE
ncbi:hypothetical protein QFZ42_003350 [Variovorax paradoxus]|uniref:hypothetical protein n=1 Tax=Variovorax paradoxus TaxID=34073 RepID=UPI0027930C19|nr:hypothetical protein [Variovorax paradoxus]MDQ0571516.1 hypothetical protein [Variovorax paradoxus]